MLSLVSRFPGKGLLLGGEGIGRGFSQGEGEVWVVVL